MVPVTYIQAGKRCTKPAENKTSRAIRVILFLGRLGRLGPAMAEPF